MSETHRTDRPNRIPWPPLIYLAAVAGAVALQVASPLGFPGWMKPVVALAGLALLAGGVLIDVAAIRTLGKHGTTVMPHRSAAALVTTGPYAFSRNPIYLGNTIALAGLALVFDVPWFLILAPVAAIFVQELAIKREEAHLAARFGDEWLAYAAKVRRWV
jgi:protein-S-isoprenylcysteine O-methyltransferase Ste14